jgi:hypothetical protein
MASAPVVETLSPVLWEGYECQRCSHSRYRAGARDGTKFSRLRKHSHSMCGRICKTCARLAQLILATRSLHVLLYLVNFALM